MGASEQKKIEKFYFLKIYRFTLLSKKIRVVVADAGSTPINFDAGYRAASTVAFAPAPVPKYK